MSCKELKSSGLICTSFCKFQIVESSIDNLDIWTFFQIFLYFLKVQKFTIFLLLKV